ncbi:MAG: ABC transporter permease [Deltaproteobacteria bacterium]|nr:ABC transporter permease [Deltaproteobacteria bacterium]
MNAPGQLAALRSMMLKEVRQTVRDPRLAVMLVVGPLLQLTLLGFAVNLDIEHVPTVVADQDRSAESRAMVREITAGDAFDLAFATPDAEHAMAAVTHGEAPVALILPRGLAEDLDSGKATALQVLVDGGEPNRAVIAQNALSAYAIGHSLQLARQRLSARAAALERAPRLPTTTVVPRVFYNPTLDSQIYFVPGVAATLLMTIILAVTAMGIAREKEVGTLEQVLVTPIAPSILVLGKSLPYAGLGLLDLALVITAGAVVFDVPLRGPLSLLALGGVLYLLSTVGLGLLVGTLARTQQQAFMIAFMVILPAIILSGFMTPVANMPPWLQPFTAFDPMRHFVEILRAVLLKGATFTDIAPQLTALAGIGTVLFASAIRSLHRSLA